MLQSYCKAVASDVGDRVPGGPDRQRKEETMRKVVRCTCGVEIRGKDDRELIERVQAHAKEAHDLTLSEEQVLAMAEIEQ